MYRPTGSSSAAADSGSAEFSAGAGSAHHPPPPPPLSARNLLDRDRRGDREEAGDEQAARYLRHMSDQHALTSLPLSHLSKTPAHYTQCCGWLTEQNCSHLCCALGCVLLRYLLSWAILLIVLLDWWNSSMAAGGTLLTAHEIKTLFNELLQLIQREDTLLRAEVVSLNDSTRRSRDELRAELAEIRRDMIAVLLNEGRGGGSAGRRLSRLIGGESSRGGSGGSSEQGDGSWLSSLAEKTGLKSSGGGSGSGGRGWDRSDRSDRGGSGGGGGDGELGAWDAGFMSGLRAQLVNLAGGDGGDKPGGQTQPGAVGETPAVDDRYKSALGTQWTDARKDDKREER